ncbi:metal ABC transporter solute-binding protein, Zn/Mn family [Ferrimonas balearica]|uniref:metal ABC transporter solute-binding protein, Zn/Mn family n=1 Tax=Ferrimonas balearica TaxID=44012 RepID=UPI001C5956D7|nr:zinc ABC transporter substrate-binding protein [Ferrimonas balearica]MBW3138890.1 zinc ABC transporter substrate-binding protein [Ferrimonas balearica]MBY5979673.1 zinc ABC transporter substrate-binding protein [Ferrimonas balearica]MBY6105953.1 zinc ABC transporter substrate-binding protein [Ferrimonas balearica]
MRALVTLLAGLALALPAQAKLTVGVALHPYYSYVSQVAGDHVTILPLVDAGFNPHNYQAQPQDMRRLAEMDAFVVNGIGHDDFAMQVIQAANRPDLHIIYANQEVALLPAMGAAVGDGAVNAHSFVGINTTIQKVYTIARELGELDPENARAYRKNARAFAGKLRAMKQDALTQIAELDTSNIKVATTHNAYGYLLQEFGIGVDAVIEPAHGVEPSASQLQDTIDRIKASGINVLFYELDMPNRFVDTIEEATGVQLYQFSHMTHGPFEADKVAVETQQNLNTLVEAIRFAAKGES